MPDVGKEFVEIGIERVIDASPAPIRVADIP
jgi:hypothetical protein